MLALVVGCNTFTFVTRRASLYVYWCLFIGFCLEIPIKAQTIKYVSRSSVDSILNPSVLDAGERILRFEQKEQTIGVMSEHDSPKSIIYSFRNVGKKTTRIRKVQTFCGCTLVDFDKQVIEPDSLGKIVVTYNPKNRVGTVDERIYVYTTDSEQSPIVSLRIWGEVKDEDQWRHLPQKMGNLRLKRTFVNFTVAASHKMVTERIWCGNSGNTPLKIVPIGLPHYMTFRMEPEILMPNEEGDMVITLECEKLEEKENFETQFYLEGIADDSTKCMIKVKID